MATFPSREEALVLAQLNIEQDASPYIRAIEASLLTWDGVSERSITVPTEPMANYLVELLQENGYTSRNYKRSHGDFFVYFK